MNHKKHLTELLQTYIKVCGETTEQKQLFWSYLSGWIPAQAAVEIFEENNMKISG